MSYNINQIINLSTFISAAGLGTANFGSAMFFCPESELPAGKSLNTYAVYNSAEAIAADFVSTDETYLALHDRWFSSTPSVNQVYVWFVDDLDADITTTLNKARDSVWWFWSFFPAATYANLTTVDEIATWAESNSSLFMNCQTGANATAIRDPNDSADIASTLTTSGYRFTSTMAHATDPYAGISLAKWYARVNYSSTNTAITGEFKTLTGVASEDLTDTEYNAMKQDTKKCIFYTDVALQGSTDTGVVINTFSHSSFGEYLDDIVNVEAIKNAVKVAAYNVLRGSTNKVKQTSKGQALLIRAMEKVGQQYFTNGYLGERSYVDPDTGEDAFTETGFVMLSVPEDILTLSSPDRAARKSAPIRFRLFPSGAIHAVDIDMYVYNS
jgi:hypothetical protein